MAELFDRLRAAVGDNYRLIEELGGGGMSRVFLALEVELDRRVVIKVLPPDMTAGVNTGSAFTGRSSSPPGCSTLTSSRFSPLAPQTICSIT